MYLRGVFVKMTENIKITDMHCDTIVKCKRENQNLFKNNIHIDLERMKNTVSTETFAIWLEKEYYSDAYNETCRCIDFYNAEINKNSNIISHVNTYNDIIKNRKNNIISSILSIEGGEAIEGSLEKLEDFYEKGVRLMTLTWNYKNHIGCGAFYGDENLTDFGKNVVKHMNKKGMIVDVSHLCDKGFYDVLRISDKPFIASHSNSRTICNSKRNLTDEQIIELKNIGGVMGINLYSNFVSEKEHCNIDDVMRHIDHIINIAGDDIIGFGCDYDGIESAPEGLLEVSCISKIVTEIYKRYGKETAEKIAFKNFDRIFSQIL
ncbi:hypothetical protein B5E58_01345 [Tyzzerella sp. An114]|nr:hypothetical protein B5E58_01345 [Tyzzerella sp. An114]